MMKQPEPLESNNVRKKFVIERDVKKDTIDPKTCPHAKVSRIIDIWSCDRCGVEFVPKNPKYKTAWV